jgi:hypothetical protein
MMSANANASTKPWRPNLEAIDEIFRARRRCRPPTIDDYAKSVGAPAEELLAWIGKITAALIARPAALDCLRHLRDLREAGRRPPCVQPSDVLRRADSLSRASALGKQMPIWPNPAVPPPNPHLERVRRDSRRSCYRDDGDEDD